MLTFIEKRRIILSFPGVVEKELSGKRYAYYVDNGTKTGRQIAGEVTQSGNGYVSVKHCPKYKDKADSRGMLSIKKLSAEQLQDLISEVLNSSNCDQTEYQAGYIEFLKQYDLYPVNVQFWQMLQVNHQNPDGIEEQKEVETEIKTAIGNSDGIYIYTDNTGSVLYVGKGKPIWKRAVSHYRESFRRVPGDTKDQRWHRFFSANQGMLNLHWRQIDAESDRRIIELMLQDILAPTFDRFR